AVIDAARRAWGFSNHIEITMEANPGSVEASRFEAYALAGVNRLSLGVQALDDASLQFLGRKHTAAEAMAALDIAAKFFPRHSFDLIYARPHQTVDDWRRELATAINRAGGHLSVYQLTIEPGTAFHGAYARGEFALPDEDTAAALYETTQAMLCDANMPAYEISNHATPGDESRHNLIYWRAGEWAGVGPGAHGRLTVDGVRTAYRQVRTPEAWLNSVEANGHGTTETEYLSAADT
ncbi:MAG: coproporphyrinogen-III oxidase family protein, partial [Alphaproteobacteria bacterium]